MNLFPQRQAQSLPDWIDIATRNLVPSAQTRVRAEIEAHFADAVRAKQAAGATELDAQAAALAELGNARAAARRFSREYLTESDALSLGGLSIRTTRRHFLCCVFLLLLNVPGYFSHPNIDLSGIIVLCILVGMSTPDIYFWPNYKNLREKIDSPTPRARQVLSQHLLLNSVVLGFIVWASAIYHPDPYDRLSSVIPGMMIAVLLFAEFRLYRLRQKIQFHHQNRPPVIYSGAANS
jgi:hypothetical protein